MNTSKILLVDDDQNISEILEFNLRNEGFKVKAVSSAEEALEQPISEYQLILLDVMMGGMSGLKMAQTLRDKNIHIPIIFLTAKDTENDMLTGFSVGGDDYIPKPFSIKEVIARIRAVLKRNLQHSQMIVEKSVLKVGPISIDLNLKEVLIGNQKIALTKTEFELLALLVQNPDTIFSRDKIINQVWEDAYVNERTVDVHITRLRKKLGPYGEAITNRSGYGYRFNLETI
ncbi:MAG TPA: response regulator transcription factor [Flavobacteriaceae bacterium]|nr:response regulator transcription factor [Flavobacteriaceae bacterium]